MPLGALYLWGAPAAAVGGVGVACIAALWLALGRGPTKATVEATLAIVSAYVAALVVLFEVGL